MLGAEIVSAANRVTPVHQETKPMWVQTQVAQQLGLRDGQIVQAVAEVRDHRIRLWVKDFFFELPNGWVLKDGDKPFLRASQTPGGWGFLIQSYPPGQTSTASLASASFGFKNMDVHALDSRMATTLGMLLTQPTGFASFSKLLNDMGAGLWGGSADLSGLIKRLLQQRGSLAQINPSMLKKAVMGQARSIENILLQEQSPAEDAKSIMKQIMALLHDSSAEEIDQQQVRELESAVRELESAQAKSAEKLLNGELSLHVILPFVDAEPVELHFQRPARKPGQDEQPLSVDIHSRSRMLGEIWLNTVISKTTNVDLMMWALRSDVAVLAKQRSAELGLELGAAGLQLHSFQIFNAPRPLTRASESSGTRGSVIDTRA